jgi:Carboxypeptidase regulatory-like domain
MRLTNALMIVVLLISAACHPGPVISTGPQQEVGGTIAGIVSTDGKVPLAGRRVTAVDTASGAKFEVTTGVNGGYTIKVPQGTYRLEVELQEGESVAKHPGDTKINRSDLDPRRDFVVSVKPGPPSQPAS